MLKKVTAMIVLVLLFALSFNPSIVGEQNVDIDEEKIFVTTPKQSKDSMLQEDILTEGNLFSDEKYQPSWTNSLFGKNSYMSDEPIEKIQVSSETIAPGEYEYDKADYETHSPITIEGNNDFTSENGVISGSGTKNDPYIIEGWEIAESTALLIEDTSCYFVVRNCFFGVYYGDGFSVLEFENCTNGIIQNVIINSSRIITSMINGIYFGRGCSNFIIEDTLIASIRCVYFNPQISNDPSWVIPYKKIFFNNCSILHSYKGFDINVANNVTLSNTSISVYNPHGDSYPKVGCEFDKSERIIVINCSIQSNDLAFYLKESCNTMLKSNKIDNNREIFSIIWPTDVNYGFYDPQLNREQSLRYFNHTIDTTNTADGKTIYYLVNEHDFVIDGEALDVAFVALYCCSDGILKDISDVVFLLAGSTNITIDNCIPKAHNDYGMFLFHSSNNIINNCEIADSGIIMLFSTSNQLKDNTISIDDNSGLYLVKGGFFIYSNNTDDYIQDIDISNTINGKQINYLVGEENIQIGDADSYGYLGIVNCRNIGLMGCALDDDSQSILLVNTTDSQIKRCTFSDNTHGIFIFNSKQIDILNCKFSNNVFGITIDTSSEINILRCSFNILGEVKVKMVKCDECIVGLCHITFFTGFELVDSTKNTFILNDITCEQGMLGIRCEDNEICYNKISNCFFAIALSESDHNNFHHNNLISNTNFGIYLSESDENIMQYNNIKRTNDGNLFGDGISLEGENNTVNYNNFQDNTVGVRSRIIDTNLDATYNYWGSDDGPSDYGSGTGDSLDVILLGSGSVIYEPFLDKPIRNNRLIGGLLYFLKNFIDL